MSHIAQINHFLFHSFVLHGAKDQTESLARTRQVLPTKSHSSQTEFRKVKQAAGRKRHLQTGIIRVI